MNIKRRIKFLVVELLTMTVVIAAAWVVLYPGGDRIAIKWLTGQEPAADSYVVRDLNPDSSLTQADPSARELLRRERNENLADHAGEHPTPGSEPIASAQEVNTTPGLEDFAPVDTDAILSKTIEIPSLNRDRPASQVGFLRKPEQIQNDCEPTPIRSLPSLSEPATQSSASDSHGTELQADNVKPLAEDLVVRLPADVRESEHSGHQIPPRLDEPSSPETADSLTWKSVVSDEMVVENRNINSAAVEVDPMPESGLQRRKFESDPRSEARSADINPPANLDRVPIPGNKTAGRAEVPQGGDFVPPGWTASPVPPVAPVVPPERQIQRTDKNGRNLVRGSKLPDLGSQNPLR